jgi:hypothetical protein
MPSRENWMSFWMILPATSNSLPPHGCQELAPPASIAGPSGRCARETFCDGKKRSTLVAAARANRAG